MWARFISFVALRNIMSAAVYAGRSIVPCSSTSESHGSGRCSFLNYSYGISRTDREAGQGRCVDRAGASLEE